MKSDPPSSDLMLSTEALISRGRAIAANHWVSYPSSARAEQIRKLISELVNEIERLTANELQDRRDMIRVNMERDRLQESLTELVRVVRENDHLTANAALSKAIAALEGVNHE